MLTITNRTLGKGLQFGLACTIFFAAGFSIARAQITEYSVPFNGLSGIAAGPDGAMWFSGNHNIGRITTAGVVTAYPVPTGNDTSYSITAGPDGAMWFTETALNSGNPFAKIGRISTSGVITEFPLPDPNSGPSAITAGPDGALWFIEAVTGAIGRITTSGAITEFPLPASQASNGAYGIASGPDGALWITGVNAILRMTTAGAFTAYTVASFANVGANGITPGPDGAMWFTEFTGKIGRITTSGSISEYPLAANDGAAYIAAGPDGALWITDYMGQIDRMTTSGTLTQHTATPSNTVGGFLGYIAAGPDGAMWFTELGGKIGRIPAPAASGAPSILTGGIVNAASYAQVNGVGSPVAPGALVAIFTSQLSAQAANFSTATLPPSLGGVSVTFNGITAPMVSVSPSGPYPYVSAQVPFEVLSGGQTSGTVPVVVSVNSIPSAAVQESIVASQPGIFTIPATGQGNAILIFQNPATNAPAIAAPPGSGITYPTAPIPRGTSGFFYVTGLGAMTPPVPTGSGTCPAANGICNANATPTVLVGGMNAKVGFAGQAPGFPGVFQVNITVPQSAPTGSNVSLVVQSADGKVTSNTATIAVQD